MQFSSAILLFLLSVSNVSAGAVISNRDDADSNFSDLPAVSDEAGQANVDYCGTNGASRMVRASTFSAVAQGRSDGGSIDGIGYETLGLVTCMAAAVTGTDANGLKWKFLGHFQASNAMGDSEWDSFSGMVNLRSLTNMKGFISYPNVDTTPCDSNGNPNTWTNDMKTYNTNFFNLLAAKVERLTKTSVLITDRAMYPPATASIETVVADDGSKSFLFKSNDNQFTSS